MTRPTRGELLWLPIVLLALATIYLPALGNELVFDDGYLASGELFAEYASFTDFKQRWLSYGSFVWLQAIFGEGWWKQRLFNLLLHVGVVLAMWALYRELLRHIEAIAADVGPGAPAPVEPYRSPALGIAVGFFALNPVAVYAVAYLVQRSIVMATLFVTLGLWLFARGLARGGAWHFVAAVACYVLAVMSKEHAILAPLAAIPVYIVVARPTRKRLAMLGGVGALVVAAAAVVLSWRYGAILGKPFDEYSHVYLAQLSRLDPRATENAWGLSILNQAWLFFHYAFLWLVPASGWMSVNLRPAFPVTWLTFPHAIGILLYLSAIVGGFVLVLRHRDWRALAGLGLLVPALLFATEFATVWVQDPFVLYRSYLWALGLPAIAFLVFHGAPARVLGVVALAIGAILVWQASNRVFSLATPERAWSDAIAKLPDDPRSVGRWFPYLNRGTEYVEANEFALALRDFEASSALGDLGMGAFNKGSVLSATGKHAEALRAFDEAERQGYALYNLPVQRAQSLVAVGRFPEAYEQLRRARTMNPPSPTREQVLLQLGRTALQLGKREEAIEALEKLREAAPRNPEGLMALSVAHSASGNYERAHALADELVRAGGGGMAHYARALANHGLRRKQQASADIEQAIKLLPENPNLREWQAKIRALP
jgi:tetratricopeptide (TPR) repeat protein